MLGVIENGLEIRLYELCPLTFYDADHNDPPLELRDDVEQWLRDNALCKFEFRFDDFLCINIVFESERDVILFKTFWL